MATPPIAPDEPVQATGTDSAADEDSAPAAGRRRRAGLLRSLVPVLALALLVVLVIVSGIFGWQLRRHDQIQTARTDGLTASRDAARVLFSYDYSHLDKDFAAGLARTTGKFRDEYKQTTNSVVRPVAQQYNAVVKADVQEAGVVQASPGHVTAVVFVNQTTTSTRVQGPKVDQSRIRMALREVGGHWLVERVDAL